jgi:hypothetical protein
MIDWGALITAIIIAIAAGLVGGGGVAAYLRVRSQNKVDGADADKAAAESWVMLITQLQNRVTALETVVKTKDSRIDDLEAEVAELREYMQQNGLNPPPRKNRKSDKGQ